MRGGDFVSDRDHGKDIVAIDLLLIALIALLLLIIVLV